MTTNKDVPVVPRFPQATGHDPAPARLKLINAGLSADGQRVQVHFVTDTNQVTTVQLETDVAANFHTLLGQILAQMCRPNPQRSRLN